MHPMIVIVAGGRTIQIRYAHRIFSIQDEQGSVNSLIISRRSDHAAARLHRGLRS